MTFCDLTIYNENPLLIRLCTELDRLPNFERFQWNICDGRGIPTGDAHSSGHLVPSFWDLHMLYLLITILFPNLSLFSGLCSSNIPRYFLDLALGSNHYGLVPIIFLIGDIGYFFLIFQVRRYVGQRSYVQVTQVKSLHIYMPVYTCSCI